MRGRGPDYASPVVSKIIYWIAVVAISLAFVVGLILWFESRDQSSVEGSRGPADPGRQPALEPGKHDNPLRGAVQRVTGGEHEPVIGAFVEH